jgi:hypothetical protein
MRKTGILVLIATVVLFFAACGGAPVANDPSSVAKAFMERLQKLDFDGAKQLATEDGQKVLSMLQGLMAMADQKEKDKYAKEEQGEVKIISVDDKGDKAIVTYSAGGKENAPLELLKENGQWKVNFQKEL